MADKYRAQVLAVQTLEFQREKALGASQLSERELEKLGNADENILLTLLTHYPAGFASSRFTNRDEALKIIAACKKTDTKLFSQRAREVLKANLNRRRTLLAGLYMEVSRMEMYDTAMFSDNLLLDVTDFLMEAIPLLCVFDHDEQIRVLALACASLASDVRAQIVWGRVEDWEGFRKDVITMGCFLLEMETILGNPTHKLSLADMIHTWNRDQIFAQQPLRIILATVTE